jgi:tRNA (cytidine/uridine-2'-O-)-methyltransferase
MFHVALWEPEIPPNTGNVARLCAATRTTLWIVGQPSFRMDEKSIKRAGLDYWPFVRINHLGSLENLESAFQENRLWCFTVKASKIYTEASFQPGDCLLFGPESRGLPREFLARHADESLIIPMSQPNVRSLNLSTSAGIGLFEALRQNGFPS